MVQQLVVIASRAVQVSHGESTPDNIPVTIQRHDCWLVGPIPATVLST